MRTLVSIVLLFAAFLLAGCAGTPPARTAATPVPGAEFDPDPRYIAIVEAQARRRNIDVVWINPPRIKDRRH